MTDPDWLPVLGRALSGAAGIGAAGIGAVRIVGRSPLAGGYSSPGVERIDLDVDGCAVAVVLKRTTAVEVAAMRAVAVVGGVARPIAIGPDWLALPHIDGPPLAEETPVPDAVWEVLARVHAHWWRKRPRGLPVVDGAWWARLCDRTLVAVRGAAARTGDDAVAAAEFAAAERALSAWRADPRILAALALLPRTLVHGDPHRGNVLIGPGGGVLIDWGAARVAPAALDLAVLRAQGATVPAAYDELLAELTAGASTSGVVDRAWADAHVNIQYLGFAADHRGSARVTEMIDTAARALVLLGAALPTPPRAGLPAPPS